MKHLFLLDIGVEQFTFSIQKIREMILQLYAGVRKGLLILWFRGYFLMIRKVLFISRL
jgi:hypothetical protein